MSYNSCSTSV